jgi:hypothetical protein
LEGYGRLSSKFFGYKDSTIYNAAYIYHLPRLFFNILDNAIHNII